MAGTSGLVFCRLAVVFVFVLVDVFVLAFAFVNSGCSIGDSNFTPNLRAAGGFGGEAERGGFRERGGGGLVTTGGEAETGEVDAGEVECACMCGAPRGGGMGRGFSRCCFWMA